jgi:cysteine-S-conjugate beta-lyase
VKPQDPSERTRIVHSGGVDEPLVPTVNPPIQRASTVLARSAAALYDGSQTTYGRKGLATHVALGQALADLEGAAGVRLYPSGLAAITGALTALVKAGDHVLVAEHVYRPTRKYCDRVLSRFNVQVQYFTQRASIAEIESLIRPQTRLIFLESPGSLSFQMQDVSAIAECARRHGVRTLIDNTWAAGLVFRPLQHGVDISLQSLSKYVAGHSDVFMGSAACRDRATLTLLDRAIEDSGSSVSPEDAYLVLRALHTLPTRLDRHAASALQVAGWLAKQPEVAEVLYPPLPDSPDHALWKSQYSGASGLMGVVLEPVAEELVRNMMDALEWFGLGFSWGGHESLGLHCDPQRRWGSVFPQYRGPLLRLHIGLEDPADLIADLRRGLDQLAR